MRKTTELSIRARAAIRYPGWRLDIVGPTTAVLTNVMGRRRTVTFRRRRKRCDGPWMRLAKWAVPMVIWMTGMWMMSIVIMAWASGVKL